MYFVSKLYDLLFGQKIVRYEQNSTVWLTHYPYYGSVSGVYIFGLFAVRMKYFSAKSKQFFRYDTVVRSEYFREFYPLPKRVSWRRKQ